jgi:hypothetical protein
MSNDVLNELPIPQGVLQHEQGLELLRVWAAGGRQHVAISVNVWDDPAAWGLMLVDLAKHIAKSHTDLDYEEALSLIKKAFDAEWQCPTDVVV